MSTASFDKGAVAEARADMLHAISDLKAHLDWYLLGFSLAQVALEVGLIHALR